MIPILVGHDKSCMELELRCFYNAEYLDKHGYITSCVLVCERPKSLKSHLATLRNKYVL